MTQVSSLLLPQDIDHKEGEQVLVYARMTDKPFIVKQFQTSSGLQSFVFFGNIVIPYRLALVLVMHMGTYHVRKKHIEQTTLQLIDYWANNSIENGVFDNISKMDTLRINLDPSRMAEILVKAIRDWVHPRVPKDPGSLTYFSKPGQILKLFYEASEAHK